MVKTIEAVLAREQGTLLTENGHIDDDSWQAAFVPGAFVKNS